MTPASEALAALDMLEGRQVTPATAATAARSCAQPQPVLDARQPSGFSSLSRRNPDRLSSPGRCHLSIIGLLIEPRKQRQQRRVLLCFSHA